MDILLKNFLYVRWVFVITHLLVPIGMYATSHEIFNQVEAVFKKAGDVVTVAAKLENMSDPNITHENGYTVLHYIISLGFSTPLAGLDALQQDKVKEWYKKDFNNKLFLLQSLLDKGANPCLFNPLAGEKDKSPYFATFISELLQLAYLSFFAQVSQFLKSFFDAIAKTCSKSIFAEYSVVSFQFLSVLPERRQVEAYIIKLLIEKGLDIKVKSRGRTLTHQAAWSGNAELLEHVVNLYPESVNLVDDEGCTPLYLARGKEVADCLINHGADIHVKNKDDATPLDFLVQGLVHMEDSKTRVFVQAIESFVTATQEVVQLLAEKGAHCTQAALKVKEKPFQFSSAVWGDDLASRLNIKVKEVFNTITQKADDVQAQEVRVTLEKDNIPRKDTIPNGQPSALPMSEHDDPLAQSTGSWPHFIVPLVGVGAVVAILIALLKKYKNYQGGNGNKGKAFAKVERHT